MLVNFGVLMFYVDIPIIDILFFTFFFKKNYDSYC